MTISTLNAAQTFSDIIGCKPVGYIWEGGGVNPLIFSELADFPQDIYHPNKPYRNIFPVRLVAV